MLGSGKEEQPRAPNKCEKPIMTFGTVNRHIRLHRLKTSCGLNNSVLTWFSGYLIDTTSLCSARTRNRSLGPARNWNRSLGRWPRECHKGLFLVSSSSFFVSEVGKIFRLYNLIHTSTQTTRNYSRPAYPLRSTSWELRPAHA